MYPAAVRGLVDARFRLFRKIRGTRVKRLLQDAPPESKPVFDIVKTAAVFDVGEAEAFE